MKKKSVGMIRINNAEDITWQEGFDRFHSFKKAMNLSDESLAYYERVSSYFVKFLESINHNLLCKEVHEDTIYDYMLYLKESGISDKTVESYMIGLRAILYYFMEKGYVNEFKVKIPKAKKVIKETYTEKELEKLLVKPDINTCSFAQYRNWVMVCFLLATGMRMNTLCNVKIGDIDFDNHEIRLRVVKNKKQYIIPLSSSIAKTIKEYLIYRDGTENDYLFCNSYGEQLTKETIESAIRNYNRSRGVEKTSIHTFRHTFAKNWILNGGDIFRLQRILGHSTLDMVREYVNMYGADLQEDFDLFNPLENMTSKMKKTDYIRMNKSEKK